MWWWWEGRGGEGRGGKGRGGEGRGGRGGEGRGGDGSCNAMVFQEKNFLLWVRGGGGFVGDLLEGRKKAETRLIGGGGGGGVVGGWGTSEHFPNSPWDREIQVKKVKTTIKPLLLGKLYFETLHLICQ